MNKAYRPGWPLLVALVLGVAGLVTIASIAEDGDSDGDAAEAVANRYVEGIVGAPSRVNPLYVASNPVDSDLSSLVFSGLTRLGPDGTVQPDLAETWGVSEDGRTYLFALRSGVRWQDGDPFDATDVVFTIETIQDPDFDGDASLAEVFDGVEVSAPNSSTVIMRLSEPYAPFLALGATTGILPAHLLSGLDAAEIGSSPFNQRPVGTGPYELESMTATEATLTPNSAYYLGRPAIEELDLRFYSDEPSLLAALREEDSDVEGALLHPGVPRDDLDPVLNNDRWATRELHPTAYSLVYLNPQFEPFKNVAVRKALQQGTDRDLLIDTALAGQAIPINSPIPPGLWATVPDEAAYAYDPARADALLNEAGWTLDDGVRVKDGEPLAFSLSTSDDAVQAAVGQEIARQWGELGVQVTLESSGATQFIDDVLLPRAFDAALATVNPGADPDPYPFWHSSAAIGNGRNLAAFSDAYSDRLLEDGRLLTTAGGRVAAYAPFQQIFATLQPAVLLETPTYYYALPSNLQGPRDIVLFGPSSRFYDIQTWQLETAPALATP